MKKIIFLLFNNYLNLNDRKKNRVVVQRSQFVSFVFFFFFFFCRPFFYNCRSKDWFEVSYFFSYTHRKKKKKERMKDPKNKKQNEKENERYRFSFKYQSQKTKMDARLSL